MYVQYICFCYYHSKPVAISTNLTLLYWMSKLLFCIKFQNLELNHQLLLNFWFENYFSELNSLSLVSCSNASTRHSVSSTFSVKISTLYHFIFLILLCSNNMIAGFSLPVFLSIRHSITSFIRLSPLKMCSSHRFFFRI